jgi:hypothetical protein
VGRALALSSNEDTAVPEGIVRLYIVPPDSGTPSGTFLDQIKDEIETNYPIPIGVTLFVLAAIYKVIDVEATVYLSADTTESDAADAIVAALEAFFAAVEDDGEPNELIQFGYDYKDQDGDPDPLVALSDVGNAINDLAEVRRLGTPDDGEGLLLDANEDDVVLVVREFPKLGDVTLVNGDTGGTFYGGAG